MFRHQMCQPNNLYVFIITVLSLVEFKITKNARYMY